jgi:phenylalanyl-tRNA synthetase beta subunit
LAAQIYEKSPDPELSSRILAIASNLILERAGGKLSSRVFDHYPNPTKPKPITLNLDWLKTFAGVEIATASINQILRNLGFTEITITGRELTCFPPLSEPKTLLFPKICRRNHSRIRLLPNPRNAPSLFLLDQKAKQAL